MVRYHRSWRIEGVSSHRKRWADWVCSELILQSNKMVDLFFLRDKMTLARNLLYIGLKITGQSMSFDELINKFMENNDLQIPSSKFDALSTIAQELQALIVIITSMDDHICHTILPLSNTVARIITTALDAERNEFYMTEPNDGKPEGKQQNELSCTCGRGNKLDNRCSDSICPCFSKGRKCRRSCK